MLPVVIVMAEAASRTKYPVGEAVPASRGDDAAVPDQDTAAAATNDGRGSGRGFVRPLGHGPGDHAMMRAQGPFRGAKGAHSSRVATAKRSQPATDDEMGAKAGLYRARVSGSMLHGRIQYSWPRHPVIPQKSEN